MTQDEIQVQQRYRLSSADLSINYRSPFFVKFELGQGRTVELRTPTEDEMPSDGMRVDCICEVTAPIRVSEKRKALLDQIARGKVPDGSRPDPDAFLSDVGDEYMAQFADDKGNLLPGVLPDIRILPRSLQDFIEDTSEHLYNLAERTLRLLRWRGGFSGTPAILSRHLYFEWSDDGAVWHAIWSGNSIGISIHISSPMREEYPEFVVKQFDAATAEPLGHELYHEAELLRERNPRSALLALITAAEVGVKQCITSLVPTNSWLIENTPSPDVVSLLRDYLPTLPVKAKHGDIQVSPPPRKLLDELKGAISARNALAHTGANPPVPESLERDFRVVKSMLWLLDYYRGEDWAIQYVSAEWWEPT
jgi:hypothetical protein